MSDPRTRLQVITSVGVLGIALIAGAWYGARPPAAPPVTISVSGEPTTSGSVTVHVSGAVTRPGLVVLAPDSLVADAIAAAGGATPSSDLSGVNLAAPIRESEHLVVPEIGAAVAPPAQSGGVDLNRATAAELESLPGVGPVLAGRIVAHREERGPFESVEDLLDVPGIGEAKLLQVRESIAWP